VEPRPTGEEALPTLVAQRVTATIQREAPRLVRLETEHEAFLTTPEHPFATPSTGSGPTWQERLQTIRQEQNKLIADWRARLSARLNDARQRREDMRRVPRLHDEDSERALTREIDLLERELQNTGG
jgi:hypothetical protein